MIGRFYHSIVTMNSRDLFFNIVMLLCIFLLKKTEVESASSSPGLITRISPPDVNLFLQEGGRLVIEFGTAVASQLYRESGGSRTLMPSTDYSVEKQENNYSVMRIVKTGITASDAGQYICVTIDRGDGDSEELSVRVQIAKTNVTQNATLLKEYEDVTLGCEVNDISNFRLVWKKLTSDPTADVELTGDRFVKNENGTIRTLTVKKASRVDVGEYQCIFIPEPVSSGTGNVSATPIIFSEPFVDAFHGSVSPLQGDDVTIHCSVYGYPLPGVTWLKGDSPFNPESNKTAMGTYRGVANATLTIYRLVADDRAYYTCKAGVNASETILVRVKDRYAALWPFIGIIVEVIVLILVILIYEKRKSRSSSDDDSDTHSGNKTNSHGQKGGDLRHRNIRT